MCIIKFHKITQYVQDCELYIIIHVHGILCDFHKSVDKWARLYWIPCILYSCKNRFISDFFVTNVERNGYIQEALGPHISPEQMYCIILFRNVWINMKLFKIWQYFKLHIKSPLFRHHILRSQRHQLQDQFYYPRPQHNKDYKIVKCTLNNY